MRNPHLTPKELDMKIVSKTLMKLPLEKKEVLNQVRLSDMIDMIGGIKNGKEL